MGACFVPQAAAVFLGLGLAIWGPAPSSEEPRCQVVFGEGVKLWSNGSCVSSTSKGPPQTLSLPSLQV